MNYIKRAPSDNLILAVVTIIYLTMASYTFWLLPGVVPLPLLLALVLFLVCLLAMIVYSLFFYIGHLISHNFSVIREVTISSNLPSQSPKYHEDTVDFCPSDSWLRISRRQAQG